MRTRPIPPTASGGRNRLALGDPAEESDDLTEEALRIHRESEELRQLTHEDGHGQAVHIADHGGFRDQVCDEPELADARNHERCRRP